MKCIYRENCNRTLRGFIFQSSIFFEEGILQDSIIVWGSISAYDMTKIAAVLTGVLHSALLLYVLNFRHHIGGL